MPLYFRILNPQMETAALSNATRFYVMAVTPTRLYSFTGIGSLEVRYVVSFWQILMYFLVMSLSLDSNECFLEII